jgi:hypothetical protein
MQISDKLQTALSTGEKHGMALPEQNQTYSLLLAEGLSDAAMSFRQMTNALNFAGSDGILSGQHVASLRRSIESGVKHPGTVASSQRSGSSVNHRIGNFYFGSTAAPVTISKVIKPVNEDGVAILRGSAAVGRDDRFYKALDMTHPAAKTTLAKWRESDHGLPAADFQLGKTDAMALVEQYTKYGIAFEQRAAFEKKLEDVGGSVEQVSAYRQMVSCHGTRETISPERVKSFAQRLGLAETPPAPTPVAATVVTAQAANLDAPLVNAGSNLARLGALSARASNIAWYEEFHAKSAPEKIAAISSLLASRPLPAGASVGATAGLQMAHLRSLIESLAPAAVTPAAPIKAAEDFEAQFHASAELQREFGEAKHYSAYMRNQPGHKQNSALAAAELVGEKYAALGQVKGDLSAPTQRRAVSSVSQRNAAALAEAEAKFDEMTASGRVIQHGKTIVVRSKLY